MKVLVTGGAGFIGSFIVDELIRRGHTVRILDNLDPQVHPGGEKPAYLNPHAEFMQGDVRDAETLKKALDGREIVFHEAAAVGMGQSQYLIRHYVDVNIGGTANLLDILANTKHSVQKLIVAASQSSYGEGCCACPRHGVIKPDFREEEQLQAHRWEHECPQCGELMPPVPTPETTPMDCRAIYAMSKRDQEEMALNIGRTYNLPTVALRYFNVYGPRQSLSNPYTGVLAIFMSRLANGNSPVIYEDGLQTRDFISVHDIVQANLLAMENDNANYQVFNVGMGIPTTIKDVALMLAKVLSSPIEPTISLKYRKGDTRHSYADITKIQSALNYQPRVTLEEGMKELVEWSRTVNAEDKFEQAAKELAARGLA
jgi:dTDP-L-rhamnose 4-epimerase